MYFGFVELVNSLISGKEGEPKGCGRCLGAFLEDPTITLTSDQRKELGRKGVYF
jgi:hypothetical protein